MAGQTTWDKNTNVFDKVLTTANFTAITPSGSIVFSSTANPVISGTLDMQSLVLSGDLTVSGTAYFNSIVAVTSSYSSGSTIFGDALIDTHQFTGSVFITGSSFLWNNNTIIASNVTSAMSVASASQALTASYFNGSVTSASYALTASFLQGTASQALTASKIFISNLALDTGSYFPMFANNASGPVNLFADALTYTYQPSTNILTVTSSLSLGVSASSINSNDSTTYDTSNINSINWDVRRLLDTAGNGVIDWAGYTIVDSSGNPSIDWGTREAYDESFLLSIKYDGRREMYDTTGATVSLDWGDRILVDPNGTTTLDWSSPNSISITGSLSGSVNGITIDDLAWTSYTPTWTTDGTQPTLGDGSLTGAYKLIGKTCFVRVRLYWGTTTNSGTGTFYFSLPVSASTSWGIQMPASLLDNGNAWYQATVNGEYGGFTNKTALIGQSAGGANSSQGVTGVFPVTFGNLDSIQFNGSYETV